MKNLFWNLKYCVDWTSVFVIGVGALIIISGIGTIIYGLANNLF